MKPHRLLIVTDEMEVGGSQQQITNLLESIDQQRFEPHLLYFRQPSHLVDRLESAGVVVTCIPKRGKIDPAHLWRLIRYLTNERFDLVHAFSFTAELWIALALSLSGGPRPVFISSVRGTYEWYRPWQWRAKRMVTRRSRFVATNAESAGRYAMDQMGLGYRKLRLIANGIAPPAHGLSMPADLTSLLDAEPRPWILTFVGRLVDHKDLPTLIEAMAAIEQQSHYQNVQLLIVGDGPLRGQIQNQIDDLGIKQITLLGERTDVAAILAHSDAGVLPSIREGLSNTLLESMMAGLPMVATRVGGTPSVIEHMANGLLIEPGQPDDLAAAIGKLFDDRDLARQLGEQARRDANANFSVAAMVEHFESMYDDALERSE